MGQPVENGANGSPSSNAARYNIAPHFIGGSHLGAAPPSKVKDFVAAHGGHTVIQNVSSHPRDEGQEGAFSRITPQSRAPNSSCGPHLSVKD